MRLCEVRLIALMAASVLASPALGQGMMNMPGMTMPMAKKPVREQAPARKAAPRKKGTATLSKKIRHRKASAATMPKPVRPSAPADMRMMPGMEMPAGHKMSGMATVAPAGTDLPAGNAPPPPFPTDRAADRVYGPGAMAMGRHHLETMHGGQKFSQVMVKLAEYQARRGRDGYEWNGEAWYGGDIDRLWLKSEGEGTVGRRVEKAEVQTLFSHAVDPYFNVQGGVRYDVRPRPSRVYATVGFEGLAPSFFDVEGALFLSNKGELLGRLEGYYDQRITQRLILQPRAELNFAAQNVRQTSTGAGLSDAELGLRLRYDIRREFSPYVGVQYRRSFGKTRSYLRAAGEDAGGLSLLAGIRTWF